MKTRKQEYGNANMVGRNIEFLRKSAVSNKRTLWQNYR